MVDIQGGYAATPVAGYAGQIADMTLVDVISRECEDATLGFGLAVIAGTAERQVKVGAAGAFAGIAVRDRGRPAGQGTGYVAGDTVPLLRRGAMWVNTVAAVTAVGAPVYRTATGTLTPTATDNTLIVGATFETLAAAGGLTRIRLH